MAVNVSSRRPRRLGWILRLSTMLSPPGSGWSCTGDVPRRPSGQVRPPDPRAESVSADRLTSPMRSSLVAIRPGTRIRQRLVPDRHASGTRRPLIPSGGAGQRPCVTVGGHWRVPFFPRLEERLPGARFWARLARMPYPPLVAVRYRNGWCSSTEVLRQGGTAASDAGCQRFDLGPSLMVAERIARSITGASRWCTDAPMVGSDAVHSRLARHPGYSLPSTIALASWSRSVPARAIAPTRHGMVPGARKRQTRREAGTQSHGTGQPPGLRQSAGLPEVTPCRTGLARNGHRSRMAPAKRPSRVRHALEAITRGNARRAPGRGAPRGHDVRRREDRPRRSGSRETRQPVERSLVRRTRSTSATPPRRASHGPMRSATRSTSTEYPQDVR